MADHWAIIVGINQYHFLQPLMQAQNDALGMWRFLVEEAGFAPQQCILLSDLSVSTEHQAVYPDRKAIESWVQRICQDKLEEDDVLWVFFSGYGAQADGDDYLMPVDGDPAQVTKTGIKVSYVVESLKQAATQNIVLILDINRSQSALAGQEIGAQAIELAQMAGIPLLLSCDPSQFSHETLAVRHGLFTAALLEGLRYQGCLTLGHLSDYIQSRVPELCEHHWRPIQTPVAIMSDAHKFEILLPQSALDGLSMAQNLDTSAPDSDDMLPPIEISSPIEMEPALDINATDDADDLAAEMTLSEMELSEEDWPVEIADEEPADSDITATIDLPEGQRPPAKGTGKQLRNWGILAAVVLIAGVLLRNQPFWQKAVGDLSWPAWLTLNRDSGSTREGGAPDTTTVAPEETEPDGSAPIPGPEVASEQAAETTAGSTPAAQQNAELLEAARRSILPNQASQFADAIATASQIQPGEPLYEQAQADIDRWSQVILDLASGRAAEGNLPAAIAAAQLIPPERQALYAQAQERIQVWEQRQRSRDLIRDAQQIPRSGQASSYQQGILVLQQIPTGQPEYQTAQALIDDWSQKMLSIAQARAAQGKTSEAINAATLIPKGTAAYDQAQADITRWQGQ
jgi:hypothetical protein